MKLILSILAALLLVAPGIGMTDTQAAYLQGFHDGLEMMNLYRADVPAYNIEASAFNASLSANLNESEAAAFMLPLAAERVAPVPDLFNSSVPIEELRKA
ncbi:hypothetical protein M0R72_17945 [Candidatus Pacearchaeota archaeon]|jgi:hypothetical protein|nr:hypothetical protein [Candidatus Pacearchaeota archaeon]